jgi:hypothetical protein
LTDHLMYALKERGGSGAGADGGTVTVGAAAEAEQDSAPTNRGAARYKS